MIQPLNWCQFGQLKLFFVSTPVTLVMRLDPNDDDPNNIIKLIISSLSPSLCK